MIVAQAHAYSASLTDAHKPTSAEQTSLQQKTDEAQQKDSWVPNAKLYTFEEFYNIVHGREYQGKPLGQVKRRPLITDRAIRQRAHSIEQSSQD
jgi:hypothetical protein